MAIGETPESVRVGDLRRSWRRGVREAGMKRSISELRRKVILYFSERRSLRAWRLWGGPARSESAASLAASSREESSFFVAPLPFRGEYLGILPRAFWRLAAAYALSAECCFWPRKAPQEGRMLEIRPVAK